MRLCRCMTGTSCTCQRRANVTEDIYTWSGESASRHQHSHQCPLVSHSPWVEGRDVFAQCLWVSRGQTFRRIELLHRTSGGDKSKHVTVNQSKCQKLNVSIIYCFVIILFKKKYLAIILVCNCSRFLLNLIFLLQHCTDTVTKVRHFHELLFSFVTFNIFVRLFLTLFSIHYMFICTSLASSFIFSEINIFEATENLFIPKCPNRSSNPSAYDRAFVTYPLSNRPCQYKGGEDRARVIRLGRPTLNGGTKGQAEHCDSRGQHHIVVILQRELV